MPSELKIHELIEHLKENGDFTDIPKDLEWTFDALHYLMCYQELQKEKRYEYTPSQEDGNAEFIGKIQELFDNSWQLFATYNHTFNEAEWYLNKERQLDDNDNLSFDDIDWNKLIESGDILKLHQYDYGCFGYSISKEGISVEYLFGNEENSYTYLYEDMMEGIFSEETKSSDRNIEEELNALADKFFDTEEFQEFFVAQQTEREHRQQNFDSIER